MESLIQSPDNKIQKHAGGRPSKYTDETLEKLCFYFDNWKKLKHAIPSIAGLADYLEVDRRTIYRWADDDIRPEFCHMLARLLNRQELTLLNSGLNNELNSNIVKLALTKHGYTDRAEIANFNPGNGNGEKYNHQIVTVSADPTRVMGDIIQEWNKLNKDKEEYQKENPAYKFEPYLPSQDILDSYLYPVKDRKEEDLIHIED